MVEGGECSGMQSKNVDASSELWSVACQHHLAFNRPHSSGLLLELQMKNSDYTLLFVQTDLI